MPRPLAAHSTCLRPHPRPERSTHIATPERVFDLDEVMRIACQVHGLDAYIQHTGGGTYSVWVQPVVNGLPHAMAGPGNRGSTGEGKLLSRAVDLTMLVDEYEMPPEGTAADMGLTTEAEVAAQLARVVRDNPHPGLSERQDEAAEQTENQRHDR